LTTLSVDGMTAEMTQLEDALVDIIGEYATYMRPPYLSTNPTVLSTLADLGYHVISTDIDTLDYNLQAEIAAAAANFEAGLDAGGSISLAHDVHENTVQQLIPLMIEAVNARGLIRESFCILCRIMGLANRISLSLSLSFSLFLSLSLHQLLPSANVSAMPLATGTPVRALTAPTAVTPTRTAAQISPRAPTGPAAPLLATTALQVRAAASGAGAAARPTFVLLVARPRLAFVGSVHSGLSVSCKHCH